MKSIHVKILFGIIPVLVALAIITATGCSTQTINHSVQVDSINVFSESGEQQTPERWWTVFEDSNLDSMVSKALESNFNLASAWYRLRESQAIVDFESASFFPQVDAIAEGEITQSELENIERLQLGLSATYEMDLWGRIGDLVEAEQYRAKASFADYRTAAISLSAEVVRTWFQLVEARNQLALVEEQISTNETVLRLMKVRFGRGQIRSVDILRQKQLLESTQEQKIFTEARVNVIEHQLAVLMAQPPQNIFHYKTMTLPELPPMPATGLPMELVERRPDVQVAFNLLKASDRDLAAAISNRYPRLSLSASVSTVENNVASNLFDNWIRTIAGNIVAPLFDGGEREAEVDRNRAVTQQRLYEYSQTVLLAFQEVENALISEKKQVERIKSIRNQLELAEQTYQQLRIEYFNGLSNYLDVLVSLRNVQQLQRDHLSAKLVLLEYRIALYRSLAGGFETEREIEKVQIDKSNESYDRGRG